MTALRSATARLTFDPTVGNIPELVFSWGGVEIAPLHRAAWTDEKDALAAEHVPPVDRKLAGDFVCAPFGTSDVEPSPSHGWTANSPWTITSSEPSKLIAKLDRSVMEAAVSKELGLSDDAPILYQRHTLTGGSGGLTFAHHPMIDVSGGARLCCSAKRLVMTNSFAIVPDHNLLALAAQSKSISDVPGANGESIDITQLPIANDTEDFAVLIEGVGNRLGWTAVLRQREQDIIFVLKDPAQLPLTMLWHSNGARTDFPWNGRNRGVLGIEDGRAAGALGHAAALAGNPFADLGIPTVFELREGRSHTINHVIGVLPNSEGWSSVEDISVREERLDVIGDGGKAVSLPFDSGFFSMS